MRVLTDTRGEQVVNRIKQEIRNRMGEAYHADSIDLLSGVSYKRNSDEEKAYLEEKQREDEELSASDSDEEMKGEEVKEEEQNEYIFLIDRSGSMYHTIKLARRALVIFLYSLPAGSRFNVCSYGSRYQFLFPNERSVPYNDENLRTAVS